MGQDVATLPAAQDSTSEGFKSSCKSCLRPSWDMLSHARRDQIQPGFSVITASLVPHGFTPRLDRCPADQLLHVRIALGLPFRSAASVSATLNGLVRRQLHSGLSACKISSGCRTMYLPRGESEMGWHCWQQNYAEARVQRRGLAGSLQHAKAQTVLHRLPRSFASFGARCVSTEAAGIIPQTLARTVLEGERCDQHKARGAASAQA